LLERLEEISKFADTFPFNSLQLSGEKINGVRYGFVAAGVPYSQLLDALNHYGITDKVSILKLGLVYPPPKELIKKIFAHSDEIVVVEELEPFLENIMKQIAFEEGYSKELTIHGKDIFPQNGEFSGEIYLENIARLIGLSYKKVPVPENMLIIPPRLPILCPGCGHRSMFYAIKQVEKTMKTKFVNSSDIGCYTLAVYKPLEGIDTEVCMGGSIGLANGIAKIQSSENPVLAILGDSTFFHSGIPALINAVFNKNNMLVVILDNRSTSMTGFQENPGTGITITNEPGIRIVLEDLVKGCGVSPEKIWVEDAYKLKETIEKLEEAVKGEGVRVFISRHLCSLVESNQLRAQQMLPPSIKVDQEKCIGCMICINKFGCQALNFDETDKKVSIESSVCRGCKVCIDVCPQDAIYEEIE
jgi:indolepyruvate ferredoxin oxidoreductase alpha subunit